MLADAFLRSGKVRDLHRLDHDRLVLVASDRISAFDVVLHTLIPDKGRVLTGLSRFWFAETAAIVPNHLLGTDPGLLAEAFADEIRADGHGVPEFGPLDPIRGRIMICRRASVVPIEAVVRGYIAGSGWKEYQERGTVCGIALPRGLRQGDQLPQPIFTPATKAERGEHDQNISFDDMIAHVAAGPLVPRETAGAVAEAIRDRALRLYGHGAAIAASRGILLADTKFEFGLAGEPEPPADPGRPEAWLGPASSAQPQSERFHGSLEHDLILIDEIMTPDSSRFWDAERYEPGRAQASFDKQFVRDWLEAQPWNKTAPGPALPGEVVDGTRDRYVRAYERITGASFERYLLEDVIAP